MARKLIQKPSGVTERWSIGRVVVIVAFGTVIAAIISPFPGKTDISFGQYRIVVERPAWGGGIDRP